ncbi:Na(+)-translocating NADH-quinone reductase subunit A [Dysgonomonas sp. 216]|uniref:Na(+)-translocating NADH-quinone reductase subunit A n=1 Tax=Dysgonomonas sp. 216 TaxID=2302934 RepID=UPI0013D176B9|nr:Na(+)-translocating NADH-quinone reductase subunit A [Dysgonomonas sp. 216]NDW17905.1 Na(+)-translocating NADH-quinone reductase subunit A [Dysgonomonas sp. 216]
MQKSFKIKKGLNIPIEGEAPENFIGNITTDVIKIYPEDFPGLIPKVDVKIGDIVKAGTPLMHDKNNTDIVFVSPVSGEVTSITRGEKRKLLDITVKADPVTEYVDFDKKNPSSLSTDEVKESLLKGGLWPFIKQRPYDVIANPLSEPRDIFVTAFSTAPLAPSYDFILDKHTDDFQTGLDALTKLTQGKVYLGISNKTKLSAIRNAQNVEIYEFDGPHPAGNTGVQINKIKPVNKGECVWTVDARDVIYFGQLFNNGHADFTRTVAYTGSEAVKKGYYSIVIGTSIKELVNSNTTKEKHLRFISGNVLSGTKIDADGHLRFYDSHITVIPEGDDTYEMLGWATPGFNKYSAGCTFFTKLFRGKKFKFDARLLGGRRAIIMSNEYDRVFPMDIMPEFLIKAAISFNIDKMEQLGIYEVAPEDFALCEFVDTSKLEIQKIIRDSLLKLKKEME